MSHLFQAFDSPEEFADKFDSVNAHSLENPGFYGPDSKTVMSILRQGGDTTNEAAMLDLIDQLTVDGYMASGVPLPQLSYWGSKPDICAYLNGKPKSMTRRVPDENSSLNTPIAIYVDTCVSAAVTDEQIRARGVAVGALVLAMQSIRPVELYAAWGAAIHHNEGTVAGIVVKLSSRNVDTGRLCYCLTDKGFLRRACIKFYQSFTGARQMYPIKEDHKALEFRALAGLADQDIYIRGGHLYDTLMLSDPLQWVKNKLEQHKPV